MRCDIHSRYFTMTTFPDDVSLKVCISLTGQSLSLYCYARNPLSSSRRISFNTVSRSRNDLQARICETAKKMLRFFSNHQSFQVSQRPPKNLHDSQKPQKVSVRWDVTKESTSVFDFPKPSKFSNFGKQKPLGGFFGWFLCAGHVDPKII